MPNGLSPADYRANASECRRLAGLTSDGRRREQCLELAAAREDLAGWREFNIAKQQKIALMISELPTTAAAP